MRSLHHLLSPGGDPSEDSRGRRYAVIDDEACLECGVCLDKGVCLTGALQESGNLKSEIRKLFGRLTPQSAGVKKTGRTGSWDVKTCDSGRELPSDMVIVRMELGRPSGGVALGQAEELRLAVLQAGYVLEEQKSYTKLCAVLGPEGLTKEAAEIRVLSVCLEVVSPPESLPALLKLVDSRCRTMGIVFRINVLFAPCLMEQLNLVLEDEEYFIGPRCKVNLGFSRREEGDI